MQRHVEAFVKETRHNIVGVRVAAFSESIKLHVNYQGLIDKF